MPLSDLSSPTLVASNGPACLLPNDDGVPLLVVRVEVFLCFDDYLQCIYARSWLNFEVVYCDITFVPQFGCDDYVVALRTVWMVRQIKGFGRLQGVGKWSHSPSVLMQRRMTYLGNCGFERMYSMNG